MASTRKSPGNSTLLARVTSILGRHAKCGDRIVAGLSGGVDSVVLLDLLQRGSKKIGYELAALHVNHQINPAAARWAAFCRALCRQAGIKCTVVRVNVPRGNSLEAAARDARYRVFSAMSADFITLAHNLDDQAETVLLQLLRGSGAKGLSAMPELRIADRVQHNVVPRRRNAGKSRKAHIISPAILRPLLETPRSEIVAYAQRRGLEWIEDDSNSDPAFDRNFVRHQVLPVIAQRYPAYRRTLLRASRNFAETAQLLEEIAAADVPLTNEGLSVDRLRSLTAPRAKNAVRYFLGVHGAIMPNSARLEELVRQLLHGRAGAHIAMELGDHQLLQFAGQLTLVPRMDAVPASFSRAWNGESSLALTELGGTLRMRKCRDGAISLDRLLAAPVSVRLRQGGERFRADARRPRRSLKSLLRDARLAPWRRARLPLLYSGEQLVYVPGIGVDPAYRAAPGEPGIEPLWEMS